MFLTNLLVAATILGAPASSDTRRAGEDVLRAALNLEDDLRRSDRHAVLAASDLEAATLYPDPTLAALNARFFGQTGFAAIPDASAPEGSSVASTLQHRRGTCVGLAIELHTPDAQVHNNRLVRTGLGAVAGARADFARALELQPDLAEAEHNLRRLGQR